MGEMIAQEIGDSQEELLEKKQIVEKVLDRLAYHDNVLVPISKTGLQVNKLDSFILMTKNLEFPTT